MSSQGGGHGAGEGHTDENKDRFTDANELMYKSLLRLMVSQLVNRLDINEKEEFGKTTVHKEEKRKKLVARWVKACTVKFPITEQARAALRKFFPRSQSEEHGDVEEEIELEAEEEEEEELPEVIDLHELLTTGPNGAAVQFINAIE